MMNKLFRKQKETMSEMQEIETNYPYTIEVGHSKSGSAHILVIKSLKVRGDNVEDMMNELKEALKQFDAVSEVA